MKSNDVFNLKLMLTELIIVICFFAAFSVISIFIMVKSHQFCEESRMLTSAITAAQSAAECYKAGIEPTLYYSKDWVASDRESASYIIKLNSLVKDKVKTAEIVVSDKNGKKIYSLTAKTFKEVNP